MPEIEPVISRDQALDHVRSRSFTTGGTAAGAEVEWIVVDDHRPDRRPALDRVAEVARSVARTRVTFEPGGQLEFSSEPGTIAEVCGALASDVRTVGAALAADGISILGIGLDPDRAEQRLVHGPRYDAMETYFDSFGPEGRRMMCATAAIQINVDSGNESEADERWRLAHALGPPMIAAFANSPVAGGVPTGWKSARLANWWRMDTTRTWPASTSGGARESWADYVLRARVMMIRRAAGTEPVREAMTFSDWIERGHPLGWPTTDDLDYHITTLFPPVRARAWLEIRYLDALPDPWWRAAVAAVVALMNDPEAAARARVAAGATDGMWTQAARHGMHDPILAAAAAECIAAARDALPRIGADQETIDALDRYARDYVARRRSPADDRLDAARRNADDVRVAG